MWLIALKIQWARASVRTRIESVYAVQLTALLVEQARPA